MSKLRDYAKGQECQVRLIGVCNFNSETTVLAHLNMSGISGRGLKSPDQLGAWCCSSCHDAVDGKVQNDKDGVPLMKDEAKLAFYQGIFRTQYKLINYGLIK